MTAATTEQGLAQSLASFLRPALAAPDLCVSRLDRKSTGMSRENWTFLAESQARGLAVPLILRRDPIGGMLETDRRAEYAVLVTLQHAGLPIPKVVGADLDGSQLGRPSLVMEIAPGACEYFVLTGDRPLDIRLRLARDFLDILIELQAIDATAAGLDAILENPGPNPALHELARWRAEVERVALEPMPEMELVHLWLHDHARSARKTVLVHGDYKPGNALVHDDRFSAILDWETAHRGDPLEDLGWITNPVRAGEHQIQGHWERVQIADAYRARTHYAFDDDELHWWNVFSCWKLAAIVLTGLRSTVDGKFDRIHHNPTGLYRRMLKMVEF